jgi:hypothetical protein
MRGVLLLFTIGCSTSPANPAVIATPGPAPAVPPAPTSAPPHASSTRTIENLEVTLHGPGALRLRNTGGTPIRLAFAARIELQQTGRWEATHHDLLLFESCPDPAPPPDGCITLEAHATYNPVAWTGWFTQCHACDKNVPAAVGTYRFVVTTCDRASEATSDPSIITSEGTIAGPPRAN